MDNAKNKGIILEPFYIVNLIQNIFKWFVYFDFPLSQLEETGEK